MWVGNLKRNLENKLCIEIEAGNFIDTISFNTKKKKNINAKMLNLPRNLKIS